MVGRLDVVLVDVARQRQATGERPVPELRPVLALGLVVPLGVDRQVTGADRDFDVLLRVDPGQFGPDDVVVAVEVVLDPDRLGQVRTKRHEGLLEPLDQVREHRPRVPTQQSAHLSAFSRDADTFTPSHDGSIGAGQGQTARRGATFVMSAGPRSWRLRVRRYRARRHGDLLLLRPLSERGRSTAGRSPATRHPRRGGAGGQARGARARSRPAAPATIRGRSR